MFKHDIKRILLSWGFYVAIILFVILGVIQQHQATDGMDRFLVTMGTKNFGTLNRYILSTCGNINSSQIKLLLPVITALPCANLYLQEFKSKYLRNVLTRTNKAKYVFSKIITAVVAGAGVVLISELILLIICFIIDPSKSIHLLNMSYPSDNIGVLHLYNESILKFCLFESINLIIFGAVYSLMTLCFSALWNNKYLAYSTGYLFANIIIDELHNFVYTPWVTTCINLWDLPAVSLTYKDVLIQYACIVIVSITVFITVFAIRSKSDV